MDRGLRQLKLPTFFLSSSWLAASSVGYFPINRGCCHA
jgi:hypothetical protein